MLVQHTSITSVKARIFYTCCEIFPFYHKAFVVDKKLYRNKLLKVTVKVKIYFKFQYIFFAKAKTHFDDWSAPEVIFSVDFI